MGETIQSIISKIFSHKRPLLLGLALVLVFSFVPLSVAHASFWDGVINVIVGIVAKVLGTIADLMGVIFKGVAGVMIFLIKYFMSLGVTPGAPNTPSFVGTSFNLVRQFVNIFFILILVFIGLATILRLQSYQLQKTLPLLIIMALLINFSGVFVGFIVDMSNLVANSFLNSVVAGGWNASSFHDPTAGAPPESRMANYIARILFYLVATLIYFVLILVFAVRTMFLWTLTILAPLAFASYILPATKGKIWDEWFKQLIQWSIFVIPLSLFLYLAQGALEVGTIGDTTGAPWLGEFLAPFTALFILYIGVIASQQMAPAAAKAVADFGKNLGMKGGALAGRAAWKFRGVGPLKMEKGLGEKFQGFGERLRKRGEVLPLIQTKIAEKEKELGDFTAPGRAALTPEEQARAKKLDSEITELKRQEEKAKKPRTGAENLGYYTGGFLARWAGRAIERGSGAITAQVAKKDAAAFAQAQTDAQAKKAESNLDVLATELVKPEFMRDKAKIAGIIAGMRLKNDCDEIEDAVEKKHMFTWEHIGKKVLVSAFESLGSYGLRPMTLANAGRYTANPKEHGFNADPIFDPENPGRVIGFKGPDAKWLTDHILNDVPRRLEAATVKTNATAPRGSYQPFDIRIDINDQVSFAPNAQSSQAFEYSALFSGRTDIWQAVLGLREGTRAQATANLWRNVDPLSLGKEGVARFIKWVSASQDARNLGVQTDIKQEELAKLATAIETGRLTKENLDEQTQEMGELREIRARYMNEGRDSLKKFLQQPDITGAGITLSDTQITQVLKLLGREGGTYSYSPTPGGTPPPAGHTPGSPPPNWTRGTPLPPGWTWTPP